MMSSATAYWRTPFSAASRSAVLDEVELLGDAVPVARHDRRYFRASISRSTSASATISRVIASFSLWVLS
jgi:hypothetical protein